MVVLLRVVVAPAAQTLVAPVIAGTTGSGLTVTVSVVVPLHAVALVPVMVYIVVVVGLAVTVAPVVAESPVEGVQA